MATGPQDLRPTPNSTEGRPYHREMRSDAPDAHSRPLMISDVEPDRSPRGGCSTATRASDGRSSGICVSAPPGEVTAERDRVATNGWGDGCWPSRTRTGAGRGAVQPEVDLHDVHAAAPALARSPVRQRPGVGGVPAAVGRRALLGRRSEPGQDHPSARGLHHRHARAGRLELRLPRRAGRRRPSGGCWATSWPTAAGTATPSGEDPGTVRSTPPSPCWTR